MEREEWLRRRKCGIGGSDVAALLGVSPWRTALDVYYDKVGAANDEPEETEAMRIGTELEDYVARSYERDTGLKVVRFNALLIKGHSIGNLDRLVIPAGEKVAHVRGDIRTDTLLECKTSTNEWDDVPEYYVCQVQHYMGLNSRLLHADVGALFLGMNKKFRIYRVEREDVLIRSMQEAVEAFWAEHVEKRIPPPPANEADCRKLWNAHEPGKIAEADDALAEVAARLREVNAGIKRSEEEADALRGQLMTAMGDAETLMHGGAKLATWKNNKPSTKTDWQALAVSLKPTEAQIEEFTTIKPGARVFRLAAK